jgi:hypothetical protein
MSLNDFRKYDHVVRLGHLDAFGLCDGLVHVFPKLDGTNSSVWLDGNGEIQAGSRSRVLSEGADNAGFLSWVHEPDNYARIYGALSAFGEGTHIYGEWLVPHTIKGYREDAWRRFWMFDVWSPSTGYVAMERYGDTPPSWTCSTLTGFRRSRRSTTQTKRSS